MKTRKMFPVICLAAIITWGFVPAAFGALVTSDKQVVYLGVNFDPTNTTGSVSFSKLMKIKPDGSQEPFVLPAGKAIVITYINFSLKANETSLIANADLRMGPFYARTMGMGNGNAGYTENFDPGILISATGFSDPRYNIFYSVDLKDNSIIQGQIQVKLIGYLASYPG